MPESWWGNRRQLCPAQDCILAEDHVDTDHVRGEARLSAYLGIGRMTDCRAA